MAFVFISLLFFASICCEFLLSNFGFIIPVTALALYYVTVTQGLPVGIIFAVITGIIIDASFYRADTYSPVLYCAVVLLASSWVKKGQGTSLFLHLIPGGTSALICSVPFIIDNNLKFGLSLNSLFDHISHLVITFIISGILLPVMIVVFDILSEIFEFPLYSHASKKGYRR